jgi:hypothetical protein
MDLRRMYGMAFFLLSEMALHKVIELRQKNLPGPWSDPGFMILIFHAH